MSTSTEVWTRPPNALVVLPVAEDEPTCSQCSADATGISGGAYYCSRHMPPDPNETDWQR
jgi:hypothetical protein